MSYTLDLSDIDRSAEESITAQIAQRIRATIEDGQLAAGDKLPSTRALAEEAGINHLTAVRVYRRLAEDGYVTAGGGRGTFVRSVPPPAAADDAGVWQHAVLPDLAPSYVAEVMAETMRMHRNPDTINMSVAWTAPELHPVAELRELADEL